MGVAVPASGVVGAVVGGGGRKTVGLAVSVITSDPSPRSVSTLPTLNSPNTAIAAVFSETLIPSNVNLAPSS